MNRIYRVVFNAVTGVWQAVSEVARGPGKSSRSARRLRRSALAAAAAGLLALASAPAYAACSPFAPPPGMTVTCSGSIYDYSATGADLTFNIAAGALAQSTQQGAPAMNLAGIGLTFNSNGIVAGTWGNTFTVPTTGLRMLGFGPTNLSVNNLSNTSAIYGRSGDPGASLSSFNGLALDISNSGVTTIVNNGSISVDLVQGATGSRANLPAVAVYGGGRADMTNNRQVTGRIGFAPSLQGNVFTNAGNIFGSVSMGAGSSNRFNMLTGSGVYVNDGNAGRLTASAGVEFAPSGIVDGGAGGNNTLSLQLAVASGAPDSSTINTATYVNFNHFEVNSGTWSLRGQLASGGNTSVSLLGGALVVNNNAFAGSNTIDARGGTLRSEFGPLTLGNAIQLGRNLSTGGSGLTVDGVNSMTLNGLVSGGTDASLYKAGTGLLKLSGANSYAGGTTLSGGTLSVGNDLALGTGALTVAQASTLDSSALVALANDVVVNNHLTVDSSNQLRLDGTVSGAPGGGLVKTGTGTLMLARANSYSGGTTLSGGTLTVGNDLALGTGALTVAGASTLTSSAAVELANDVALNASLTVSGNNALGLNGTISGTAGAKLIKRGAGNLQLGGSNTFAGGVELNGGTLTVARAGALGSGPLVVSGNSRLAYQQSQALPGDVTINFPVTLELASDADLTSSGRIAGSGTLAKTGLGDLTLAGVTNIFTGTLDVRQGTLTMAAGSTLGSNPNLNVAAGATVRLNSAASVNNLSGAGTVWTLGALSAGIGNTSAVFDGQLRGSGSLTKVGSGTLTLNGSNGMTGKTDVNAGTLVLNGSLAAGPVTVKSGATLSGSGSTSGALTVEAGGKLGLRSGSTLRLGSLALNAGSSTNVTLGAPTTTPMAQVAGSLALNGTFNFTGTDALGNGVYRLFDYGGLLTSNLASIGALPEGITAGQLQLQTGVANQVNVVVNSPNLAMQFWDGNYSLANGVVNGGGGIWSAAGTNWTNASGSRNTAWAGDSAIFQGTGGGVEVEGSHDVKFMQFTGNGYQLVNGGAGQLNLVNADGGSAEVRVDADVTARIGVNMAGEGTLSKTSAGTLVLTGNNQYRGGTTLKAGRIVAHSDSALGTGALTASSGTALANQQSVSLGNSLQLAGDLTLDAGSTMTLGGAISGQGGLSKAGSGTLVLNGRNEMEGDFALNAGGVVIGNAQALGKGTLKAADGTSIDSRVPGVGVDNDVALTGALTVLGTRDLALTGTVSGNGNLIKAGGAALNLLGANTLDGSVTLAQGTLRLGTDTSLGNAALNVTGAATLQSAADIAVANRVRLDGNLTVVGGNALAFDGLLSGTAGLVKDGSGTLALGQANSYLGNTELKAGTLRLGNAGALSGGMLKATGSAALESTSSMNLANAVDISGSLTLQGSHDMTLSGAISGSGSLTKAGTGTLTLTGANTATGTTSVDAGRLLASAASLASGAITNNAALELMQQTDATLAQAIGGSGDLTKSGAGTLTLTGANTSTGGTAIIAGQLVASAANLGSGMLVNHAALELRQDTDATLAQDIAGSGDMVKSGSGTLTLTGANTSTGLTGITGGRLVASVAHLASGDIVNNAALELRQDTAATLAQALGGSGDLIKSGTGTLTLAGTNTATGGTAIEAGRLVAGVANLASGGITNNAALEIQQSDNAVLAQALGGNGELIKSGAGTLTLAGANTSTGGTTIDAGRLVASAANLGSGAITNNAALELKQASDATLAQAIGGSGELTKTGAGTLTLTGANTSTGGTTIVDGELVVSTANLGSGAIVNDAALQLKQDSDAVLAQDISGSGHLLKSGSGTLTLTGTNTSTGLTGIASGRLVASATNLASGAIINMAQLELNQAGEATLAQAISGSGQLIKSGTGTLTLTGSNTATGSTTIEAGRLVASVASLGSGAIVNNAALEIRQSTNAVLAQAISGSGDLIKSGSAVLTLAGSNTSTGATTIEAGRLIASAANLGSGAITNHAALEIHQAQDATLAQAISGSGDLTKSGAGTLTLTGANSSTGGTAIIAGRVVASAANLGSGIIANNAALELKQESDATLAQAIAGSGELSKTGAGTLTLTGANTSTGATHIDAGRLVASSANLGSGTITNNAALELQQAADGTLTQAIAGSGGLTKTGAGTLTLTGRNSYAGDTLVSAGSLKFADADAQFSPGNTLAGNIQVAGGAGLEIATAATLSVGKAVELLQGAQLSIQSRGAQPSLVADSLQVGAEVGFNLSGIGARSELDRVLVSTNNGITGDFAKVHVGGFSGEVDYLTLTTGKSADGKQYLASYGLNWSANNNLAQGSFTLAGAGEQFDVGVALDDQGANGAAGWNGKTLSKKGAGTLVLSADNGYTGGTQIEAGTLQVGNGGTAGTLGTGSVANEGTLAFNRSNLLHVDNEISGSGNLVQKGTGTTVLLADNRYTGTTTIEAGTLQVGNGGTTGALGSGNVINNATLGINRSDAVTLSNAITGSGSLHQQGTGTTTLTGANDYRGGTTISAGRLIASSDSLGSGAITNHAALEVNQAGNGTLAQAISGTGDLTKSGAGTLTLTGANSSTGGTTIEAGRLIAGAGNLGSGTISNNAALELKQETDATLAQAIGGTGDLTKSGAGTLTLTGTNTSTGGTTIEAGRLIAGAGNLGSGTISNNAALELKQINDATLAQAIGGTGELIKSGAGTLTLTGANSSTGGTTIEAGRLIAGAGNLGGGTISNNAALELKQINDATLAQAIGGTGELIKSGAGTLTLTGANTSTGGTTIEAGRLIAGAGNLGSGTISNNAALELKQINDATLAQAIGGTGELIKSGAGTLTLTGANNSTGGTTIEAGRLIAGAGNLGSGAISNNAALELKQINDATLAQAIGGSGELIKSGAGTLTLTGANTSTGGTTIEAGRLIAGAGNLGSGAISNNAALELKQSTDATLAQAIGGTGELIKSGAGTLTLTSANTSTGGTTIEAGRLIAGAGNLGSGAITNNAALELKQSTDATLAQAIGGTGELIKSGAGTLTLSGENTSTGGTRIEAGRLIAAAGHLGRGAIVNNATLELNQALDATLAQSLAGSGQLVKSGAGTLALTSTNTSTGGTVIEAGRLVASVANLGSGAITNNAALELNQAGDATLAQALAGNGSLTKTGAGTLAFTGNGSAYTGSTAVDAGTLAIGAGAVLGGSLHVAGGASLTGSGSVGSTTLASGAIIAPGSTSASGHSYGTLTVNGDLRFAPGSTYQFHADPDSGTSDRLQVSGTVQLAGGLLHVGPGAGFDVSKTYTLLHAASLQGQFDTVSSNYAYLDPKLQYNANSLSLLLERKQLPVDPADPGTPTRPIEFADLAQTRNQTGVANAVQSLQPDSALYRFVQSLPEGTPAAVFESLSGEVHSTAQGSMRSGAQLFGNSSLRHLHSNLTANLRPGAPIAQSDGPLPASAWPSTKALPMWAEVVGHWQSYAGDGNAARLKQSTGGLFLGGDSEVAGSGWRVGGSLGYTRTDARVADRSSTGKVDSYSAAVYGGKSFGAGVGQLNVMGGLAYTWHEIASERHVAALEQTLKADYHAGTSQLFAEVGYALGQYGKVGIEPFAGISLGEQRNRGFQERGGFAALRGDASRDDLGSGTLGLRMHSDFKLGGSEGRLRGTLGWRHAFGDVSNRTSMAFEGGQNFTVAGVPLARNTALLGLEAELELSRNAALVLGYKGEFGSGNRDHSAQVRVRWAF